MPYVRIHIDAYEVLPEVSDDELRAELIRRSARRGGCKEETSAISRAVAKVTLVEAAHRLRKLERFDLAYKLDEIRHDYF